MKKRICLITLLSFALVFFTALTACAAVSIESASVEKADGYIVVKAEFLNSSGQGINTIGFRSKFLDGQGEVLHIADDIESLTNEKNNAGLWISKVEEGSIAEAADFRVGDVVVSVNGVSFLDDIYFAERGKALMAEGESVDFVVERSGELITLSVTKPQ